MFEGGAKGGERGGRTGMCDLDAHPAFPSLRPAVPLSLPPPPQTEAEACKDHDLKDLLPFGFAIHHAGG